MPTLQTQPELQNTKFIYWSFQRQRKGFNLNLNDTNITFWTTPSLKKTNTFQHHYIQAYHHCIQRTKNFIADGDIYHTLLVTDTWSYPSLNADRRSKELRKNSHITSTYCTILVAACIFILHHWTGFHGLFDIESLLAHRRANSWWQKKPLASVVLTTISSINGSTTLIPLLMTYHLMLHRTPPTQLSHKRSRSRRRHNYKPANIQLDHSSVIYFSSCSLSTDEISVLSRGLTFCPRHINWPDVLANIYDFSRRMRLTAIPLSAKEHDTPFHNKSTWNPPNGREWALNC